MSYQDFKANCADEIQKQSQDPLLESLSKDWFAQANKHNYSYHFEFLGRPLIQYPQDIVQIQELIWQVKPDLIIETGIAHGGSLILSASMLSLLDVIDGLDPRLSDRKVIGIDIDIRKHNRKALEDHPLGFKLQLIEGSSVDEDIARNVHKLAHGYAKVLVLLDSNHTHDHVLTELKLYSPLVSVGSYCVVFDTGIEDLPPGSFPDKPWGIGNNPKTAIHEWLSSKPGFTIDNFIDRKLLISVAPDGYLKRLE